MVDKLFTGTLVCFDISDSKARNQLGEVLKDLGMERIQESVFYGLLTRAECKQVMGILQQYCSSLQSNNRAFYLTGIDPKTLLKSSIGYSGNVFSPPENVIL